MLVALARQGYVSEGVVVEKHENVAPVLKEKKVEEKLIYITAVVLVVTFRASSNIVNW